MTKRFLASRPSGFYFRVLREGEIGAGDEIMSIAQDDNRVSISDALKVYLGAPGSGELPERALRVKYLSDAWREEFSGQV
jgi:MOSC domain-containing protein YiiM